MFIRALSLVGASLVLVAPTWRAKIEPKNGGGLSGEAMVEQVGRDSSKTTVELNGAPANASLGWHIHTGPCTAAGPVVGTKSAYPALKVDKDGHAKASVNLAVTPLANGVYSISVHKSPSDLTTIACGDLQSEGSMMDTAAPAGKNDPARP
jgi:hypothetical protein